ncbi:MAG: methylenetetrahydrofolate--tRNA-(uracil(54)-C(5))-methyltransferase (FADH(2)-oxidizing) TrmFO [Candidatus Eremiobacteraeota bacterium]|nr:methylenetetrahydrofolate--tRNA-(uracil(54)-C(5))-methyltransferase (FADH(2)-oxidizing) TrmFO [Candidatus Eremiobacteraeota bacterium]
MADVTIVGGGLAGCEAAWQAARQGASVVLFEMRPRKFGPAHHTASLAELVCSNSLRGASLENAVGLLKEELARLDSVIVTSAREAAVPAGGDLAVDRERFGALVEARLAAHPDITIRREEVERIPRSGHVVIACGPLPSEALATEIDDLVGGRLHYYDAAAPIVALDSLDLSAMYRKSRYDKGEGDDYLNIPLDRATYARFVNDLRTLPKHQLKEFEADEETGSAPYFEGCLPIEELAARGDDALRFGPLKPVGLRDPRTGRVPHAVVQLRKENAAGTALNLVGFQTRLTWPAQKEAFSKLPGLANAEWLRLGVMHRNTFIDSPRLLGPDLRLRADPRIFFAGQVTGAEGYVEAAACGAVAGLAAAREVLGLPAIAVPPDTALGAVVAHLQNGVTPDFQPANVTWTYFSPLAEEIRDKRARRAALARRALDRVERFAAALAPERPRAAV